MRKIIFVILTGILLTGCTEKEIVKEETENVTTWDNVKTITFENIEVENIEVEEILVETIE